MLQNNTLAWARPSWKQQNSISWLAANSRCATLTTVSWHSAEISWYNSASGCADWHTIDNVIEMMMMTRTTMIYSVNVGRIHMCLMVLRPVHRKLGCEFACKLLLSTSTIAIQHYWMQEPVLILPSFFFSSFLFWSVHYAQQPHSGWSSDVFRRFGHR